jgi:hypothetical protein
MRGAVVRRYRKIAASPPDCDKTLNGGWAAGAAAEVAALAKKWSCKPATKHARRSDRAAAFTGGLRGICSTFINNGMTVIQCESAEAAELVMKKMAACLQCFSPT